MSTTGADTQKMGGCTSSAAATEKSLLVAEEGKGEEETVHDGPIMTFLKAFAIPCALLFYVFIAVTKTLLTKVLMDTNSAPVAFSATSCWVTCLCLVPVFIIDPKKWGYIQRQQLPGFALVTALVALDLAFTNIAMSLLALALQQVTLRHDPSTAAAVATRACTAPATSAAVLS